MIGKKMEDAFNDQVAAEYYSSYLYLSMAAFLEDKDLPGMANWMRVQYQEETFHAEKIFDYVIERDGRAEIKAWDAPPKEWKSPLDAFEDAFKHEQKVTALINNLVDIALAEKDHASNVFLQWYVTEQVEEEASVKAIVQQLRMLGESRAGLFQIDRELGRRTFTAPTDTAE